jgi:hypothetical protein
VAATGTLDRYRNIKILGSGGMGTVTLAEDTMLGRRVALKRVHTAGDPRGMSRLRREALVGASLNHPNLVSVYDVLTDDDGDLVVVMEYVAGETLRDAIRRRSGLPVAQALRVLHGVATGLDAIHARGIVHRDVKPANILLGTDTAIKLADLGVASVADRTQITTEGAVLGTFSYMAPEQLEGRSSDPAMDIYALSAVAYEVLTGHKARPEPNPLALAHAISTQPPPDVRGVWPQAPAPAANVLQRGMARDPAQRPRSAGELAARLRESFEPETTAPGSAGARAARPPAPPAPAPSAPPPPPSAQPSSRTGAPEPAVSPAAGAPPRDGGADVAGARDTSAASAASSPSPEAGAASAAAAHGGPTAADDAPPSTDRNASAGARATHGSSDPAAGASSASAARGTPAGASPEPAQAAVAPAGGADRARPVAHASGVRTTAPAQRGSSARTPAPAPRESAARIPVPAQTLRRPSARPSSGHRRALVLAGLLALVAAVVIVVVSVSGGGSRQPAAARASHPRSSGAAATSGAPSSSSASASAPSASASPAASGAAAPSSATPVGAVEGFYGLATEHRYADAWALADPQAQAQLAGYRSFVAQQSATRSIRFNQAGVVSRQGGSATVAVQTTSVRTDGSHQCGGTVSVVSTAAGWRVHQFAINCTP